MQQKLIRILHIEDSPDDAELVMHALVKAGWKPEFEHVKTAESMKKALELKSWELMTNFTKSFARQP